MKNVMVKETKDMMTAREAWFDSPEGTKMTIKSIFVGPQCVLIKGSSKVRAWYEDAQYRFEFP